MAQGEWAGDGFWWMWGGSPQEVDVCAGGPQNVGGSGGGSAGKLSELDYLLWSRDGRVLVGRSKDSAEMTRV